MLTVDFDYELPEELIAQYPLPRGHARLLVLNRTDGSIEHRKFADLTDYLMPTDILVTNNTRVTGRRIQAKRTNGLPAEVLLISPVGDRCWHALVKPGRSFRNGSPIVLVGPTFNLLARVVEESSDGGRKLELESERERDEIACWGSVPLPPYIRQPLKPGEDELYQTVYGTFGGSAAAPTAGLHFDNALLAKIQALGVKRCNVTLNIGIGTFRPVRAESISEHTMHSEVISVTEQTADVINTAAGRIVAIGTTTVRTLESSTDALVNPNSTDFLSMQLSKGINARCAPFQGETDIFITPGYQFRAIDALVTNFHQPKSTLLMLISAFAGHELVKQTYREAIEQKYRFFSFGDAMLII